jgi:hypothetical protein
MASIYEKDSMMVAREIADELILVPIRHNVGDLAYMYTLNGVASRIWELLNGGITVDEIVSVLTLEYEVEAEQAKADVIEFLAQMKEIGAVVEKTEGS